MGLKNLLKFALNRAEVKIENRLQQPDGYDWFEVYYDYALQPPYLLVLLHYNSPENFVIFNPLENKVEQDFGNYEDALAWLGEDGFYMVEGRENHD